MKKLSRRELFKGAGAVAVGGVALAVGLQPAAAMVVNTAKCSSSPLKEISTRAWKTWHTSQLGVVQLVEPDGTLRTIVQVDGGQIYQRTL